ncbi:protein of unknown function [Streptomyces sp. KY75]|nr:protein of unknown function [Streptomyces sp. KY75]CAD5982323.1 protein of unknown function [Streptomyces sp. KY70]
MRPGPVAGGGHAENGRPGEGSGGGVREVHPFQPVRRLRTEPYAEGAGATNGTGPHRHTP